MKVRFFFRVQRLWTASNRALTGLLLELDYIDVAGVISNYSAAGIPLETMWTDIGESLLLWYLLSIYGHYSDYMFKRRIFTMDPEYFPPARMREIIDYLHKRDQRYGMFHILVVVQDVTLRFQF